MDSSNYNHEIGRFCSQLAMLGYAKIKDNNKYLSAYDSISGKILSPLGFDTKNAIISMQEGKNSVNHIIASKTIYQNNQKKTLVIAGFIGSNGDQWISNFEPGKGTVHQGFEDAKKIVKEKLTAYLDKLNVKKEDTVLLFFGHSRGAAVTNLMAADFISEGKYALPKNIFAYAFATPNSCSDESEYSKTAYQRIFNIVNREDFVTWVLPYEWGYHNYGKTAVLPSKTFDACNWTDILGDMNEKYKDYTKGTYTSYNGIGEVSGIVKHMTTFVPDISAFYSPVLIGNGLSVPRSLYAYFHNGLAKIVANTGDDGNSIQLAAGLEQTLEITNQNMLFFSPITAFFIKNTAISPLFAEAHKAQTYAAYMMSLSSDELWKNRSYKEVCVKCHKCALIMIKR